MAATKEHSSLVVTHFGTPISERLSVFSAEIDTVLRERLGEIAKPQPFQPCANIMRHNRLILAWDAANLWSCFAKVERTY